jgi:hypothetical protein
MPKSPTPLRVELSSEPVPPTEVEGPRVWYASPDVLSGMPFRVVGQVQILSQSRDRRSMNCAVTPFILSDSPKPDQGDVWVQYADNRIGRPSWEDFAKVRIFRVINEAEMPAWEYSF